MSSVWLTASKISMSRDPGKRPSENVAVIHGNLALPSLGPCQKPSLLAQRCMPLNIVVTKGKALCHNPCFINVPTECPLDELWHTHVCLCSTYGSDARSRCFIGP